MVGRAEVSDALADARAGGLALVLAVVLLSLQDGGLAWFSGLAVLPLLAGVVLSLLSLGVFGLFVAVVSGSAQSRLGVRGTPDPALPWLRRRSLAGASAGPVVAAGIVVVLVWASVRAAPGTFVRGALVSFVLAAAVVTGRALSRAWRVMRPWLSRPADRLTALAASRDVLEAARRYDLGDASREDEFAADSALLAAVAWARGIPAVDAARIGAHLAGNEAETLLHRRDLILSRGSLPCLR